jgi:WD40 repeat protein
MLGVEVSQVLLESGSHFKDSVVQAQFSHDGTYLAAADLSGVIKVWKLNGDITANKEIVWEFETSDISVS